MRWQIYIGKETQIKKMKRSLSDQNSSHKKNKVKHHEEGDDCDYAEGQPLSEAQNGLFIKLRLAEPDHDIKLFHFDSPEAGFEPLSYGAQADVFVSQDRKRVMKCFHVDEEALIEWKIFELVYKLAREYTAGPAELLKRTTTRHLSKTPRLFYVLLMKNAGPILETRAKLKALSDDEQALCWLQTIHFILLLGGHVLVSDTHDNNVCVFAEDAKIEVRWIDFAGWNQKTHFTKESVYDTMQQNTRCFFDPENWEVAVPRSGRLFALHTEFKALTRGVTRHEGLSVLRASLLWFTEQMCRQVKHPACVKRAEYLKTQIHAVAVVGLK